MVDRLLPSVWVWWVLVGLPGLCAAGAVTHECVSCVTSGGCQHEAGCADDPCSVVVVRVVVSERPRVVTGVGVLLAVREGCGGVARQVRPRGTEVREVFCTPDRFFESGLPLLI